MIEVGSGLANVINGDTRFGRIVHDPKNCSNSRSCYYLITVFFPDQNGPMKTSIQIETNITNYHEVKVDREYKNIIP